MSASLNYTVAIIYHVLTLSIYCLVTYRWNLVRVSKWSWQYIRKQCDVERYSSWH